MLPWDFFLTRSQKRVLNVPRHRLVSLAAKYQTYQIVKEPRS
jgi:hypothetical protein